MSGNPAATCAYCGHAGAGVRMFVTTSACGKARCQTLALESGDAGHRTPRPRADSPPMPERLQGGTTISLSREPRARGSILVLGGRSDEGAADTLAATRGVAQPG